MSVIPTTRANIILLLAGTILSKNNGSVRQIMLGKDDEGLNSDFYDIGKITDPWLERQMPHKRIIQRFTHVYVQPIVM